MSRFRGVGGAEEALTYHPKVLLESLVVKGLVEQPINSIRTPFVEGGKEILSQAHDRFRFEICPHFL
jgi:hypothetical protein